MLRISAGKVMDQYLAVLPKLICQSFCQPFIKFKIHSAASHWAVCIIIPIFRKKCNRIFVNIKALKYQNG